MAGYKDRGRRAAVLSFRCVLAALVCIPCLLILVQYLRGAHTPPPEKPASPVIRAEASATPRPTINLTATITPTPSPTPDPASVTPTPEALPTAGTPTGPQGGALIAGTGDMPLWQDETLAPGELPADRQVVSLGLQAGPRVDDSYFQKTVFVGDSVTLKLQYYVQGQRQSVAPQLLGNAGFLCAGSLGSGNVQEPISSESVHPTYRGRKVLVEDAVAQVGAEKVYIMLGMNDIAVYGIDGSVQNMLALINKIRAQSPRVQIFVQSATPRIKGTDQRILNNENLRLYDEALYAAIEPLSDQGIYFVDVASVMRDDEGCLPLAYCSDPEDMGIHFTDEACQVWLNYLYTHTAR